MRLLRLILISTLVLQSRTFELQDTIHKLIEENIYLHDQLENLTKALRELKWTLIHHSTDPGHHKNEMHHNENTEHLFDEWFQHGISPETHLLLEQVICESHGSAAPANKVTHLFPLPSLVLLLTHCFVQL